MTCDELEEVLPDYLMRSLHGEKIVVIDEHLRSCPKCSGQVELWEKLGILPAEQPGAMSRKRFEIMLNVYEEGRREQQKQTGKRQVMVQNVMQQPTASERLQGVS